MRLFGGFGKGASVVSPQRWLAINLLLILARVELKLREKGKR